MAAVFEREGIHFSYPENWRLECEDVESGWTVTVQSPDTAYMMLTCDNGMPSTADMADAALTALRDVYPELDADECVDSLAGQPAIGHDIQFFSLDLVNTCWTRSVYAQAGTLLVMCQFEDHETEKNEPVLKAMCASLRIEE